MKTLLTTLLLLFTATSFSQNTIWSHAIGNWRNGPVVYITPLIEDHRAIHNTHAAGALPGRVPRAERRH